MIIFSQPPGLQIPEKVKKLWLNEPKRWNVPLRIQLHLRICALRRAACLVLLNDAEGTLYVLVFRSASRRSYLHGRKKDIARTNLACYT